MQNQPFMCEFLGTPEAGKTTVISMLQKTLENRGFTCSSLRESAEIVPKIFAKGSLDAHYWMRLNTAKNILESKQGSNDIILIDRGIIDTMCWDFILDESIEFPYQRMKIVEAFFENLKLKPNLVIMLTIPAEESIRRRGGEGRIVTKEFIERFNNILSEFSNSITVPLFQLNTMNKTISEVHSSILEVLLREYHEFL